MFTRIYATHFSVLVCLPSLNSRSNPIINTYTDGHVRQVGRSIGLLKHGKCNQKAMV